MNSRLPLLPLATLAFLAGCGADPSAPQEAPRKVGVVTVREQPVVLNTELPGRIVAVQSSEVRPQINGLVRQRLFTEGSLVQAGQVLYEIEDAAYRAALGSAQGNLARAQASIEATRLQAERYHSLVALNAVSKQEFDNAEAAARQARAEVAAQRSSVEAARVNLGFTRITAPITGRIGRSSVTPGALVQAGQPEPLATIVQSDHVYVDILQSAAQILDLRQAAARGGLNRTATEIWRVKLTLPNGSAYPAEGRLQFSEIAVDPQSGSVALRALFPNSDGFLLPGMYVRAQIVEGVRQDAILAPQRAISRDPRGRATALVVGALNKVEQRKVTADRPIGASWLVTEGLKAGDRLIVEGATGLKAGVRVSPEPPASARQPASRRP